MSQLQNKPIDQVAEQGPGLVFEVYPEAIATLPGSQIWSCLFFITMIMLGMDSAVSKKEVILFWIPLKNLFGYLGYLVFIF